MPNFKQLVFVAFNHLYQSHFNLYRFFYFHYKYFVNKSKIDLLKEIIVPGMITVDVGANIGFYSIALSNLLNKTGQVHAFEPDIQNFKYLKQTTRPYRNIKVIKKAVGNKIEKLKLYTSSDLNVDHQTYDNGENRKYTYVRSITLDKYFSSTKSIDFLKIDAQGFDYQVFKGALEILKRSKNPIILGEFWPYGLAKAGCNPSDYLDLLKKSGFKVTLFSQLTKNMIKQKVYDSVFYTDFLATKSKITKL